MRSHFVGGLAERGCVGGEAGEEERSCICPPRSLPLCQLHNNVALQTNLDTSRDVLGNRPLCRGGGLRRRLRTTPTEHGKTSPDLRHGG